MSAQSGHSQSSRARIAFWYFRGRTISGGCYHALKLIDGCRCRLYGSLVQAFDVMGGPLILGSALTRGLLAKGHLRVLGLALPRVGCRTGRAKDRRPGDPGDGTTGDGVTSRDMRPKYVQDFLFTGNPSQLFRLDAITPAVGNRFVAGSAKGQEPLVCPDRKSVGVNRIPVLVFA
ncbi:hypothetical protein BD293_4667 [Roseinatronobacter monicus]|uniref:Uncharacterized protein n=1 Tax=Roseinatronobacter monicus TaxID=393481 RepID=A0A543K3I3_9RHOB|nr:hypothetical protein BD293_4667 [Roseinatronobacter monicus]